MNFYKVQLAQFRKLNAIQKRTLLVAWLWLPLFWLGLRVLGLPCFQSWLMRQPARSGLVMTLPGIAAIGEAVNVAARHSLFPATCLTRSLLLIYLLRRCNVVSELRIGVRLTQGILEAHAWVEFESVPINDRLDVNRKFTSFGDLIQVAASQAS